MWRRSSAGDAAAHYPCLPRRALAHAPNNKPLRRASVNRTASLLAFALAGVACGAHAQGGDDAARSLAATCANCHGTGGQSRAAVPSLAGQPKADIAQKMIEFRDGKRQATIMHQLAKGYTPEQIDAIAGWFAAQKSK
jgi:cytochrome c553